MKKQFLLWILIHVIIVTWAQTDIKELQYVPPLKTQEQIESDTEYVCLDGVRKVPDPNYPYVRILWLFFIDGKMPMDCEGYIRVEDTLTNKREIPFYKRHLGVDIKKEEMDFLRKTPLRNATVHLTYTEYKKKSTHSYSYVMKISPAILFGGSAIFTIINNKRKGMFYYHYDSDKHSSGYVSKKIAAISSPSNIKYYISNSNRYNSYQHDMQNTISQEERKFRRQELSAKGKLYRHLRFENGKCEKKGLAVVVKDWERSWENADDMAVMDSTFVRNGRNMSVCFMYKKQSYCIPIAQNILKENYLRGDSVKMDIVIFKQKDHLGIRHLAYVSAIEKQ